MKKSDALLVAQAAPTGPATAPSAGLLNTAGIVNGGAVAGDLDGLVDLVAELQSNGSTPTHVVLDPEGWAELRKLKQSAIANNMSLLSAGLHIPCIFMQHPRRGCAGRRAGEAGREADGQTGWSRVGKAPAEPSAVSHHEPGIARIEADTFMAVTVEGFLVSEALAAPTV